MKKNLLIFSVILSIFTAIYVLSLIHRTSLEIDYYETITVIHEGLLEVKRNFGDTGFYSFPEDASTKLAMLGYESEFVLGEDNTYTYGIRFSGTRFIFGDFFWDPMYCINEQGETGVFENWNCEL